MKKKKLGVLDYIFTYNGKDLTNVFVSYEFRNQSIRYINKEKTVVNNSTIIFTLEGIDNKDNKFVIELPLLYDKECFRNFSSKQTNINSFVINNVYLTNPYEEYIGPISLQLEEDIYSEEDNFYISKLDSDNYIIKGCLPNYNIFFWFKISL